MMEECYTTFSAFSEEMSFSSCSTGYLEDAIAEWSNQSCKRRRKQNCWDYEGFGAVPTDQTFGCSFTKYDLIPDNNPSATTPAANDIKTPAANDIKSISMVDHPAETMSTKSKEPGRQQSISTISSFYMDSSSISYSQRGNRRKVVYPFDMVKPGGIKGDMTLNDINKTILMPPTRPIRHPVGDMASNPCITMNRMGPSGKAVVALTRIHTQGRGTVTIIRTRS